MSFGLSVLSGCSPSLGSSGGDSNNDNSSKNDSTNADSDAPFPDLVGKWNLGSILDQCISIQASNTQNILGVNSYVASSLEFSGSDFVETDIYYQDTDTDCSGPELLRLESSYSELAGTFVIFGSDLIQGTAKIQRFVLTPYSNSAASKLNNDSQCEISNWQLGNPVDVSGKTCKDNVIPEKDSTVYIELDYAVPSLIYSNYGNDEKYIKKFKGWSTVYTKQGWP